MTDYVTNRARDGWSFLGVAKSADIISGNRGVTRSYRGPYVVGNEEVIELIDGAHVNIAQVTCQADTIYPILFDVEDALIIDFRFDGTSDDVFDNSITRSRGPGNVYIASTGPGIGGAFSTAKHTNLLDISMFCTRSAIAKFMGIDIARLEADLGISSGEDSKVNLISFPMTPAIKRLGFEIFNCKYSDELLWLFKRAKSTELICEAIHTLRSRNDATSKCSRPLRRRLSKVHLARDILDVDLRRAPTITQLAKRVGMSKTNLVCGFRELFGISIAGYVRKQRMLLAQNLLESTGLTVAQVADEVGFKFSSSFITAFKAVHGKTPGEYIRQIESGSSAAVDSEGSKVVARSLLQ